MPGVVGLLFGYGRERCVRIVDDVITPRSALRNVSYVSVQVRIAELVLLRAGDSSTRKNEYQRQQ